VELPSSRGLPRRMRMDLDFRGMAGLPFPEV
jgi:hypothetical protein